MTQSIGPPSLAQGTRIAVGFSTSISRFIPACGELSKPSWAIVQLDGSSPLARGTLSICADLVVPFRFIPAYAGNSTDQHPALQFFAVHPRLRGELPPASTMFGMSHGSSPLTRGTLLVSRQMEYLLRFIPAYAGNSYQINVAKIEAAVHPRLRGELT